MKGAFSGKIIVVGFGSIGKRHVQNLLKMGLVPYVVTGYPDRALKTRFFSSVREAVQAGSFAHAVIASPTNRHLDDMHRLADAGVKNVLVEKPLEMSSSRGRRLLRLADKKGMKVAVAYNMRHLESLAAIRDFIKRNMKRIRMVEALAGQHLEDWAPGRDYASSYHARRKTGGGVDLDLSHEIDYVLWLFGNAFKKKMVYRTKISGLKIDGPDICKVILDYGTALAEISLDCVRRPKERYLKITCEDGRGLYHDFITNELTVGGVKASFRDDMANSYKRMMKAFLGADGDERAILCTGEESLDVLDVLGV